MRAAFFVVALALVAVATDAALVRRKRQADGAMGNDLDLSSLSSGQIESILEELTEILDGASNSMPGASGMPPSVPAVTPPAAAAASALRRKRQAAGVTAPDVGNVGGSALSTAEIEQIIDELTSLLGSSSVTVPAVPSATVPTVAGQPIDVTLPSVRRKRQAAGLTDAVTVPSSDSAGSVLSSAEIEQLIDELTALVGGSAVSVPAVSVPTAPSVTGLPIDATLPSVRRKRQADTTGVTTDSPINLGGSDDASIIEQLLDTLLGAAPSAGGVTQAPVAATTA